MSIEVEGGLSCEIKWEDNDKLSDPSILSLTYYTGSSIVAVWPELLPFVEKAAENGNGEFQAIDVFSQVYESEMQVWVWRKSSQVQLVGVTQVYSLYRKRICNIYAVAGVGLGRAMRSWIKVASDWLDQNGIDEIQATCRDMVLNKLLRLGFRKTANVVSYQWKERL